MATAQGVNVLRYSALVAGLFYGAYHQSSITANAKRAEADREYARQERLIQQAKAEWKKKTAPKDTQNSGIITDPEDSRFDLEAYLKMKAGEN
ncbi:ATP synthase E chain-domain-containing protein [Aspergillus pseudotamarii]|uniref:ATP synthase F(0) complex subunit e, mitochondrial n=2 Tax=Aspergillus subgen. Circumdati TaxID=2720871 RepID=A0A5N6T534_ASPPS|nr:ATP synthase E chain-domain-containing protein [Aspergillus pseudotamarii]KAE8141428.1 ATP synthase E chain-domain-containing protein [Aspergillus pseudotamarii]KAE8161879.1 ATP synthase E chain-domain-containing protein [Aspergillus tamarii]